MRSLQDEGFYRSLNRIFAITVAVILLITAFYCLASVFSSFGYKQSLRALSYSNEEDKRLTVVIDAGHGGIDSGAYAGGLEEKFLCLEVAEKLAAFLSLSDVKVVMTRTADRLLDDGLGGTRKSADLRARVAIAQAAADASDGRCIFVSIHMNTFPLASCHGAQVFYSPNVPESLALAKALQTASKLADPTNSRIEKKAGSSIFILEKLQIPAVLIECGFLTNAADAERLSEDEGQNALAFSLFCGISDFIASTGEVEQDQSR